MAPMLWSGVKAICDIVISQRYGGVMVTLTDLQFLDPEGGSQKPL